MEVALGDVLIALAGGAVLLGLFSWLKVGLADKGLDARFQAIYHEAKVTLPADDLERLNAQLLELRGAVIEAARLEGWNGKRATREGKAAAIQSIASFLEIERMFSPDTKAA